MPKPNMFRKQSLIILAYIGCIIFVIGPNIVVSMLNYQSVKEQILEKVKIQGETTAYLGSQIIANHIEHFKGILNAHLKDPEFQNLIEQKKWDEVVEKASHFIDEDEAIDRIFITDTEGTFVADTPHAQGLTGINFAHRDWYQKQKKEPGLYVSEVYKRTAEPRINVVAITTPLLDKTGTTNLAFLGMQIKIDAVASWLTNINNKIPGYVYIVDQHRHPIGHPDYATQNDIPSIEGNNIIERVIAGESGTMREDDTNNYLTTFTPVEKIGWGVIANQNLEKGLILQTNALIKSILINIFLAASTFFAVTLLLNFYNKMYIYNQRSKILFESIDDGLIKIDKDWIILDWNKRMEELSEIKAGDAIGKSLKRICTFIRQSDQKENYEFIEKTLYLGSTEIWEQNILLIHDSKKKLLINNSCSPLFDKKNTIEGALIIIHPITRK